MNSVTNQLAGTGGSLTGLPRRYLVSVHHDGATTRTPVEPDEDVLNIERDLHHHLNEFPYSDAWLEQLRDFCVSRLQARQAARACGGFAYPVNGGATWGVSQAVGGGND